MPCTGCSQFIRLPWRLPFHRRRRAQVTEVRVDAYPQRSASGSQAFFPCVPKETGFSMKTSVSQIAFRRGIQGQHAQRNVSCGSVESFHTTALVRKMRSPPRWATTSAPGQFRLPHDVLRGDHPLRALGGGVPLLRGAAELRPVFAAMAVRCVKVRIERRRIFIGQMADRWGFKTSTAPFLTSLPSLFTPRSPP